MRIIARQWRGCQLAAMPAFAGTLDAPTRPRPSARFRSHPRPDTLVRRTPRSPFHPRGCGCFDWNCATSRRSRSSSCWWPSAIVALLAILAVPSFHDWLAAYQLANHAKHLAESDDPRAHGGGPARSPRQPLQVTGRRQAAPIRVTGRPDSSSIVDINRDGKVDAGEPVLQIEGAAPRGITISANRPVDDYVSYTSLGQARMLNGALQMGTFTVCRSGQRALHVVLANSGRVRVEKTSDPLSVARRRTRRTSDDAFRRRFAPRSRTEACQCHRREMPLSSRLRESRATCVAIRIGRPFGCRAR